MKISSFNIFDRELEKYFFKKFIKNFIYFENSQKNPGEFKMVP